MENVSTSQNEPGPLSRALEHEHREIDEVITSWADGAASGTDARAALGHAVDELRRHIYAEEELLFPALREAGMVGPILVMLREHGEMWPLLDALQDRLAQGDAEELGTSCRRLLALLQQHNPKEELILYPEVDRVVGADAGVDVHGFLDAGRMPAGWTCQFLRAGNARA